MRAFLPGLFVLAAACDAAPLGFTWGPPEPLAAPTPPTSEAGLLLSVSSTPTTFQSAALTDDGSTVVAELGGGTWCTFRTSDAFMSSDTGLSEEVEIHDNNSASSLVSTASGLARVSTSNELREYWSVRGPIVSARLRPSGAVAYTADEVLRWHGPGERGPSEEVEQAIPGCRDLTLDRATGSAWLACANGVVAADPTGQAPVGPRRSMGRVVWSDAAAALLAVGSDRSTLYGLTAEGEELWSTPSADPVLTVAAPGGVPYFAAIVQGSDGTELRLLSADTGEWVDSLPVDGAHLRAAHDAPVLTVYDGLTTSFVEIVTP